MIDCHLHLQDARLAPHLADILATIRSLGITTLVVNGTHPGDWSTVADLASHLPEVIPSYGLHPWKVVTAPDSWFAQLEQRLKADPFAGMGEIGLDRWIHGVPFELQKSAFSAQLDLAKTLHRPVSIHCLRAWGTLIEMLEKASLPNGFLLHSYGGPPEMVDRLVSLGAFFSVSGYFFRPGKEEKLSVFDQIPRHRLLVESDAPDQLPPPEMIRIPLPADDPPSANHPANLVSVYDALARRFEMPSDSFAELVRNNFRTWFGEMAIRNSQQPIADSIALDYSSLL